MGHNSDLKLAYAGGSDIGLVRHKNEDSILLTEFEHSDVLLFIVADGVGGHAGGDVASQLAVQSIKKYVKKAVLLAHSGGGYGEHWLQLTLNQALLEANSKLLLEQSKQPEFSNMATTVVVLLVHENQMGLSHLGDSRCYHYANKQLSQITEDHTYLQKLLNDGDIEQYEFEHSPLHHIINQALGLMPLNNVVVNQLELKSQSIFLLCSDGLSNSVSDKKIQTIISASNDLQQCVDELITRANDGGGMDNISVVLVKIGDL